MKREKKTCANKNTTSCTLRVCCRHLMLNTRYIIIIYYIQKKRTDEKNNNIKGKSKKRWKRKCETQHARKKERFLFWVVVLFSCEFKILYVKGRIQGADIIIVVSDTSCQSSFKNVLKKIISLLKCLATDNGNKSACASVFLAQKTRKVSELKR